MKKVFSALFVALVVVLVWAHSSGEPFPEGVKADRIVLIKHQRQLTLYAGSTPLKRYDVSLGRVPKGAKHKEGDMKTPEGIYRIVEHKEDSAYHRALRLSYPSREDVTQAQRSGYVPGSDIMIHGIRNGLGFIGRAHLWVDWTAGCIAVTNAEMDQIFEHVVDGATIEIRE